MLKLGSLVRPPLRDDYWNNVVALLSMDGANDSTTFTDSSSYAKTITVYGGAKLSTTQQKFGATSGYFDGTNDGISIPITGGLGSGNFTIELWIYSSNLDGYRALFWGSNAYSLLIQDATLTWYHSSTFRCTITAVPLNSWNHIACTRSSGVIRTFLNGVVCATPYTSSYDLNFANWYMGLDSSNSLDYVGYMDEVRITVGTARYTTSFTPPTVPFPTS
jgi:hypothetical protein